MRPNEFTAVDDEILNGIREILWALAWSDHVEETGCHSVSGQDICEIMPPYPQEATDAAYSLASAVVEKMSMSLAALYSLANAADDEENGKEGREVYKRESAERFGNCITYEALGHGVSWSDNHATPALPRYVSWSEYGLMCTAETNCGCLDLEVCVRSSEEWVYEDGSTGYEWRPNASNTVYLDVYAPTERIAKAWANKHQGALGGTWELCDGSRPLVYDITYDTPTLIEDLHADGYTNLDLSEYSHDDRGDPLVLTVQDGD